MRLPPFPFPLSDGYDLALFLAVVAPGSGAINPGGNDNGGTPSTGAILQEDSLFILQEDGSSILPET